MRKKSNTYLHNQKLKLKQLMTCRRPTQRSRILPSARQPLKAKPPTKKEKHCDISDANLDAQLKQVSTKNANDSILHADDSLLHAATEDNETKREESNQVLHHACSREEVIRMVGGLRTVDAEQTS